MAEKRQFPRKRRRLTVEFEWEKTPCTGFTYDISCAGIFIRATRFPKPGARITATLVLPGDKLVKVRGTVVRTFRVPATLTRLIPSGFSLRLTEQPEEYLAFLAAI
jgi:PilZ domain-containing protein